jgi:hypothetical protein
VLSHKGRQRDGKRTEAGQKGGRGETTADGDRKGDRRTGDGEGRMASKRGIPEPNW